MNFWKNEYLVIHITYEDKICFPQTFELLSISLSDLSWEGERFFCFTGLPELCLSLTVTYFSFKIPTRLEGGVFMASDLRVFGSSGLGKFS